MTEFQIAFLHGGGQGSWVWEETMSALHAHAGKSQIRALALDVPGCGLKRARAGERRDNRAISLELVGDIEAAGLSNVVLIGHSQAGQLLPLMADFRPGLFSRLVYVTCSIPLPGQTVHQMMGTGLHGSNPREVGFPFDPKLVPIGERFMQMFCNDMPEEQAADFQGRLGQDVWPEQTYAYTDWPSSPCQVPSTYLVCLKDAILPVHWQRVFAERFGAGRQVDIDAGHQAMNTAPSVLAAIILGEMHAQANAVTGGPEGARSS